MKMHQCLNDDIIGAMTYINQSSVVCVDVKPTIAANHPCSETGHVQSRCRGMAGCQFLTTDGALDVITLTADDV